VRFQTVLKLVFEIVTGLVQLNMPEPVKIRLVAYDALHKCTSPIAALMFFNGFQRAFGNITFYET